MTRRSIVVALALGIASLPALRPRAAAEEAKKEGEVPARLTSEQAIEDALASKVTFELAETPLKDAVDFLRDLKDINIQMDRKGLEGAGLADDTPVTLKVSDITLRSALRLMLGSQQLTYLVKNEVLLVTTPEKAAARQELRTYDVHDLVASADGSSENMYEPEALVNLIQTVVLPTAWEWEGGLGGIQHFDGVLVVSQQADVQEQVEDLLAAIRKVRAGQDKQPGVEPAWADKLEQATRAIEATLKKKVSLNFVDTPLCDAADFVQDAHKLPIFIDAKALVDIGVSTDTPISIRVTSITLENALRLMLEPHNLTFRVHDEMLIITTPEKASSELKTRVYPIRDLMQRAARSAGSDPEESAAGLVQLITSTVSSTTWSEVGGPGSAVPLVGAGVLVVSQTDAVFPEIDKLLALLRKSYGKRDKADAKSEPDPSSAKNELRTKIYTLVAPAEMMSDELASQLVELIPELIAPESWDTKGALARSCGDKLVVRQTAAVQKQVEKLLKDLGVVLDLPAAAMGGVL